MKIEDLKSKVLAFEQIIEGGLKEKYRNHPQEFRDHLNLMNPLYRINIDDFIDIYLKNSQYPPERLAKVIYYCMDFKLQLYYLLEVDAGLHNKLVYQLGYDKKNPYNTPHLLLTRQSVDQSIILKSRILWERGINLIYFLETGENIENKVSSNKSKRKIFFDFVESSSKWYFMLEYRNIIDQYDQSYRSPESHKNSVLRAELIGNKTIGSNDILDLLNYGLNVIWQGIIEIISGKTPKYKFRISKNP